MTAVVLTLELDAELRGCRYALLIHSLTPAEHDILGA